MAGEPHIADEAVRHDLDAAPLAVAHCLPAATDHDRAVRILLERQKPAGDADDGRIARGDALGHGELVDESLDRQAHAEPGQHRLDPNAARENQPPDP